MSRRRIGSALPVLLAAGLLAAAGCSSNKPTTSGIVSSPPKAASGLYIPRAGTNSVLLRWKDNSDSEYGFRIERKSQASAFTMLPDTIPANHITFEDFSIHPDSTYTYRVISYNGGGSAAPSKPATVQTVDNRSPVVPFHPTPTDGTVEIDPQSPVNISWSCSDPDGDPVTYTVLYGTTLASLAVLDSARIDTTFVLTGPFQRNSHYFWQIVAHDPKGVSTPSPLWGFNTIVDRQIVPGGRFVMGDRREFGPVDSTYVYRSNPARTDSFSIDRYEVNNQQFADFLNQMLDRDSLRISQGVVHDGAGEHVWAVIRPFDIDSDLSFSVEDSAFVVQEGRESFPIVQVSWYGAAAYAFHYGRRLPTEAEWEKAARGTSRRFGYMVVQDNVVVVDSAGVPVDTVAVADTVGVGYPYPWGSDLDPARGNFLNSGDPYENQGRVRTTPVTFYDTGGQDQAVHEGYEVHSGASPYGVENMAGNVWEWCDQNFAPYATPNEKTHFKVIRGGAFNKPETSATTWNRSYSDAETCDRAFGFRTVGSVLAGGR